MSQIVYDVFTLVINFFGEWLATKTIGLLEATKTIGQTLVKNLTNLMDKYDVRKTIIAYVNNEGFNLNTMIITLKSIVNCEYFGLEESI